MNIGLFVLIVFFGCLALGIPIAFALGIGTVLAVLIYDPFPMELIIQTYFTSGDTFPLLAVPFFILAGDIMLQGGISNRLVKFAQSLLGNLTGALGIITVVTCMVFAAISGSGPATTAAIGGLLIPAMVKEGYDVGYASSLAAASGALGPVIPPSICFIIYGVIAQVSITDMFIAGIIPGIVIAGILVLFVYITSRKNNFGIKQKKATIKEQWAAFNEAKWSLLVPVIILGGIYGGLVTPTEAAIIACDYGLIVSLFVYKEITIRDIPRIFSRSALTTGMVIILVSTATAFGKLLTIAMIPQALSNLILGFSSNVIIVMILVNILLLVTGMFMETLAAIIILSPLLLAIVVPLGISPIHFGIIMTANLVIGMCTPPVGVNMFVASGIANIQVERMFKWLIPFIGVLLFGLLIINVFPQLSLFLVEVLAK